jgi:hypothetical protein
MIVIYIILISLRCLPISLGIVILNINATAEDMISGPCNKVF